MTLKKSDRVYMDDSVADLLDKIDGIIFDCDGVLIDVTKSYDAAIIRTVQHVMRTVAKADSIDVNHNMIDGFKSTGGFNDEVDLTYAAILSLVAADQMQKDQADFVSEVISNADSTGIASVENYLQDRADMSGIMTELEYPGDNHNSPLCTIFDQLFYGPELYQRRSGKPSEFSEPGLIEYDDVILDDQLSRVLQKRFSSRMALVTGRGLESARHSLGSLLNWFDLKNSVFLEDMPRSLAKPNPQPLLDSIAGIGSSLTLYVGDSMEDLLMAKDATVSGTETLFCGITGTSKSPAKKTDLFGQNGAAIILDSIRQIPEVWDPKSSSPPSSYSA